MSKPKYVSIDIETTGLDPETCQVIEVAAIVDDWESPLDKLPKFHCYIHHDSIVGEPYALSMHSQIFRRIAQKEKYPNFRFYTEHTLGEKLYLFFLGCGLKNNILAAGKNFAPFDLQFLKRIIDFNDYVTFKHRCIDPGNLYFNPLIDDRGPPDTKTCCQRAGIDFTVAHTALEDALQVIQLIRLYYENFWGAR